MQAFESLDLAALEYDRRYKLLMASVVPRPIALVTSLGEHDVVNAAPFSAYVVLSIDPPLLGVSVALREGRVYKDTRRNIERTGEYVVNSVTADMVSQVQQAGKEYPPEVSEVAEVGFNTVPSEVVRPPRIAESSLQFECRLSDCIEFGQRRSALIVGEIVRAHAVEGLLAGGYVDPLVLNAVGRLGGTNYCRLNDIIKPLL